MKDQKRADGVRGAIAAIERAFGKGAIMRMGDRGEMRVEVVPTGCLSLDVALGAGGLPRGRVVEVYGPESSGKTTLALHALAQAQALGGTCAFVDAEHALDPRYAGALGVDVDELLVSQPDHGEQALEIVDLLTRSGGVDLVIVDSVAALTPRAELEGDMGDSHVGLQARLMSQALRKLTANVARTRTVVLFINQIRQKIGVTFGSGEVTTGGNALKFYASVRLEIRRIGALKKGTEVVGNRTRIKVVKNKIAPPFREAEVDVIYGQGISALGDLFDRGLDQGVVKRSGAWFSAGDERLGQGRDQAMAALGERPPLMRAIRDRARADAGLPPDEGPLPTGPSGEASNVAGAGVPGASGGAPAGDAAEGAPAPGATAPVTKGARQPRVSAARSAGQPGATRGGRQGDNGSAGGPTPPPADA